LKLLLNNSMLKQKPYSVLFLTMAGFLLIVLGLYFIFLRPSLLTEDIRFMHSSLSDIKKNIPGLFIWLQKVFLVMGFYILSTGVLTIYIAQTTFHKRIFSTFLIVLFTCFSSIGAMVIVNFMLDSDFKWILLLFTVPWIISLILYMLRK
jgi:hypothetical protein